MLLELNIPKSIEIQIFDKYIKIKGPLGVAYKKKSENIQLFYNEINRVLTLSALNKKESHFYLSIIKKLITNLIIEANIKLAIVGVGYKASLENSSLVLKIGYSHLISYAIPKNIQIEIITKKGLFLNIKGNNLQKVNEVAAQIRALKPAEPYKGKGIRYVNEHIKRKQGKKTNV